MNRLFSIFTGGGDCTESKAGKADFQNQSLALTRRGQAIQILGILAAVGSLVFVGLQFNTQIRVARVQVEATDSQKRAIELQDASLLNNVYQNLMSRQLDVDKVFVDKPYIYDYLYRNKPVPKQGVPGDVLAAADMVLDFYQLVYSQRSGMQSMQGEYEEEWATWQNTMAISFQSSPILCSHFWELRSTYRREFVNDVFRKYKWCKRPAH